MNSNRLSSPLQESLQRVRVVLCGTSHPGNIGAAARAMKTMGLTQLVLVAPKVVPDALSMAMASGASDVLEACRAVASLAAALQGVTHALAMTARRRELAVAPVWMRAGAQELAAWLVDESAPQLALVFGNETYGLSNEELAQCDRWAMIPTNPESSSLNLAAAVQVACYELRMALCGEAPLPPIPDAGMAATHDEIEGLVLHLERAARGSGFLDPAQPGRLMLRMRRLLARARLEREEVNILRGLLAAFERDRKNQPGST